MYKRLFRYAPGAAVFAAVIVALGGSSSAAVAAEGGPHPAAGADQAYTSTSAHSASFGIGASWKFGTEGAIDIELMPRLSEGSGWRTDALNLGFHVQF